MGEKSCAWVVGMQLGIRREEYRREDRQGTKGSGLMCGKEGRDDSVIRAVLPGVRGSLEKPLQSPARETSYEFRGFHGLNRQSPSSLSMLLRRAQSVHSLTVRFGGEVSAAVELGAASQLDAVFLYF
jgi:hypothetical protein